MMTAYADKTVLVTGATRGVGRQITDHVLAGGGRVLGFARHESDTDNANYTHFQVDLANSTAITAIFGEVRKKTSRIDIVINNAGVLTSQYAMIMPPAAAQAMVNVNLLAPFLISREAAKFMRKSKWGRIINIGSMAASLEPIGDSVYAATKAGLSTLANVMAKEFGTFNVTCNTLGISAIDSDMLAQLPRDKIEEIIKSLPVARFADIDDILNVIDFFASERSSYITAQTVFLGGVN
ncbi:SDR family NAD(P)-dependent oxidoreductase [Methylobacterium sp. J-059]|uniref:SDR family NAD(P)-dependent oxidoreductase n=1 Tax=Methylobacterium sp. J-059 TaxID=2836643 RepID=UPI001FB8988C|nr:SDR family NAD(P)-dependent oxidoreductase [Methylobacterium sp. J-059]MCJ2042698.1 SDR family NAD(P)-dependent oxidoreductase [Methylobacterium sp. J-059]